MLISSFPYRCPGADPVPLGGGTAAALKQVNNPPSISGSWAILCDMCQEIPCYLVQKVCCYAKISSSEFHFILYEVGNSLWTKFCAIAGVLKGQDEDKLLEGKHGPNFPHLFQGFGGISRCFFQFICKLRLPVTITSFTPNNSITCLIEHPLVCACQ